MLLVVYLKSTSKSTAANTFISFVLLGVSFIGHCMVVHPIVRIMDLIKIYVTKFNLLRIIYTTI